MYGLLWLLLASEEKCESKALLEIYIFKNGNIFAFVASSEKCKRNISKCILKEMYS